MAGDIDTSHLQAMMQAAFNQMCAGMEGTFKDLCAQWERPSAIYRPRLFKDGDKYCALYGDDLQSGCAGFGDSPSEAMYEFDKTWSGDA